MRRLSLSLVANGEKKDTSCVVTRPSMDWRLLDFGSMKSYPPISARWDGVAANESGAEQMEFAEDWSQKWILIENSS